MSAAAREALDDLRQDEASLLVEDNTSQEYYSSPYFRQNVALLQAIPRPRIVPPRLKLQDVVGKTPVRAIANSEVIKFHVVGDTGRAPVGGARLEASKVVVAMSEDIQRGGPEGPAFCFLLGDVVLHFGEGKYYYEQFYEPFRNYHRPVFAVPGNHDGMVFGGGADAPPSLDAFLRNFCVAAAGPSPDGRGSARRTMTQPGVYFTLDAPFVSIIGLYTNVLQGEGVISSDHGRYPIGDEQLAFLVAELKRLRPLRRANKRAVILACHHPPLSSGSLLADIDEACAKADLWPDAVLCGHAKFYRRFTRRHDTAEIPYILAGTGSGKVMKPRTTGSRETTDFGIALPPIVKPGYLTVTVDVGRSNPTMTIEFCSDLRAVEDSVIVDLVSHQVRSPLNEDSWKPTSGELA